MRKITPCLWFDDEGEEAARFYVSIFPDSEIDAVSRYGKEGFEVHGKPEGAAMTVSFHLAGQSFTALNGGPQYSFSEAISFQVDCETQAEVDHYWPARRRGRRRRRAVLAPLVAELPARVGRVHGVPKRRKELLVADPAGS
jgi:predicted 3-demethylubiquinone-9 3-methyltransferase (glyoxalase superfamily)